MEGVHIILLMLVFSAFFSGLEMAFVSANKLKIELEKGRGRHSALILSRFLRTPSRFIGTMLLGNNIALVIYGMAMSGILEPALLNWLPKELHTEFFLLFSKTLISTLIILFFAEFLPKMLFQINPNSVLRSLVYPVYIFYLLAYPLIWFFTGLAEFVLRKWFRMKFSGEEIRFSPVDLDHFVKELKPDDQHAENIPDEIQMFQNVIDFRSVRLRECMVPRNEIIAHPIDENLKTVRQTFIRSGHSKILVYRESIDNIIGYVHSYDMFSRPQNLADVLKPVIIVPETMLANKVLQMFIGERKSIAVVVDEFGGTAGMLTMEDIIEEIFGEINDEFDQDDRLEKVLGDGEYLLSARLEIDYLNEKYRLELPESDDYETLAGLILHIHEDIPVLNEVIRYDSFTFTIIEASEFKIDKVRLKLSPKN